MKFLIATKGDRDRISKRVSDITLLLLVRSGLVIGSLRDGPAPRAHIPARDLGRAGVQPSRP
jgi:hypothetical protein